MPEHDCYTFSIQKHIALHMFFFRQLANMYTYESDAANHLVHSYKSFKAESSETWARQSVDRSVRKVINHKRPYCFVALLYLSSGEIFEYFIDRRG